MWVCSIQIVLPTTHINMYNKNCMHPFVNCMYCKFLRINDSWFLIPNIKQEKKLYYLMGDYNINLLNVELHGPTSDFNDIMYSNGLIPLITRPTRVIESTATLIDNIYTNRLNSQHGGAIQGIISQISLIIIPFFTLITTLNTKRLISKYQDVVTATRTKTNF